VPAIAAAVYTADDAEVVPPRPVRQQWLRQPPAGPRDERVTIEILVSDRGTVETVRVTGAPRSVSGSMFLAMSLQAIKSWDFHPALKNGDPVRYRQRMSFGTAKATAPVGAPAPTDKR
jgi:hypothetical protein